MSVAESDRGAARRGLVGRLALYGSSRSVVEGLLGVRGIVLASVLGPYGFGIWALFRLVLGYGAFVGLGLLRGMELEVAKARGEPQRDERASWGRSAAGFTLAVFGLISAVLLAASPFVAEPWARQLLWAVAAGLLLERLYFYALNYLRACGSLGRYAVLELVQAGLQLVLTVALGVLFGVLGAFTGFVLANVISLALAGSHAPLRPAFELSRLRAMLSVGLPLSLNLLLAMLLNTVDRVVIGAMLGIEALGQYAFAVAVASLGLSAALVVRTVVFPDLYGRLADEAAATVNRSHLERTVRPFVLLLAPPVGLVALLLGPAITALLPQYAASAAAASLFIFAGVAQGATSLAILGVVAAKRQIVLPAFTVAALLVNAALAYATLASGLGLTGLAAGALIGRLAYTAGVLGLVATTAAMAPVRAATTILWPVVWCALLVSLIQASLTPAADLPSLATAAAAYLVGVTPVLAVLARLLRPRRMAQAT